MMSDCRDKFVPSNLHQPVVEKSPLRSYTVPYIPIVTDVISIIMEFAFTGHGTLSLCVTKSLIKNFKATVHLVPERFPWT